MISEILFRRKTYTEKSKVVRRHKKAKNKNHFDLERYRM